MRSKREADECIELRPSSCLPQKGERECVENAPEEAGCDSLVILIGQGGCESTKFIQGGGDVCSAIRSYYWFWTTKPQ